MYHYLWYTQYLFSNVMLFSTVDGGGNWHKHVSMRRNNSGGNLSRSRNPSDKIQLSDPGSSSSSSGDESDHGGPEN